MIRHTAELSSAAAVACGSPPCARKKAQRRLVGRERLAVAIETVEHVADVAVEPRHQQRIAMALEHLARAWSAWLRASS